MYPDPADELILLRAENTRLKLIVTALRELAWMHAIGSLRGVHKVEAKLRVLEGRPPTKVTGGGG